MRVTTTEKDNRPEDDELREEYDLDSLGPAVRGKHFERATSGTRRPPTADLPTSES